MVRRNPLALGLIDDDLSDIVAAREALGILWKRLYSMAYRPRLTPGDLDEVSKDLRTIEAGLAAGQRAALENRRVV